MTACLTCRGWCCYRFACRLQKGAHGPNWEAELRRLGEDLDEPMYRDQRRNIEFCRANWKLVHHCRRLEDRRIAYAGMQAYTFTCLRYDLQRGCCTAYAERPPVCKNFFCRLEEAPTPLNAGKGFAVVQTEVMARQGIDWRQLPPINKEVLSESREG